MLAVTESTLATPDFSHNPITPMIWRMHLGWKCIGSHCTWTWLISSFACTSVPPNIHVHHRHFELWHITVRFLLMSENTYPKTVAICLHPSQVFNYLIIKHILHDFRLLPWSRWQLCSSGLLCSGGNFLLTFRGNLSVPCATVNNPLCIHILVAENKLWPMQLTINWVGFRVLFPYCSKFIWWNAFYCPSIHLYCSSVSQNLSASVITLNSIT